MLDVTKSLFSEVCKIVVLSFSPGGRIKDLQQTRGGHQHLQRGWMLDINLIPELRSKGVKVRTFSKNRNQRLCLLPRSLHRSKIELFYLQPSIFGGGGGHIKPHLEVIICIFEPWTQTLRRFKYHSETGANSQTCQPPPTRTGVMSEPKLLKF